MYSITVFFYCSVHICNWFFDIIFDINQFNRFSCRVFIFRYDAGNNITDIIGRFPFLDHNWPIRSDKTDISFAGNILCRKNPDYSGQFLSRIWVDWNNTCPGIITEFKGAVTHILHSQIGNKRSVSKDQPLNIISFMTRSDFSIWWFKILKFTLANYFRSRWNCIYNFEITRTSAQMVF